jgi:uncharacterized membrane protein YciS (DUF1049 family)
VRLGALSLNPISGLFLKFTFFFLKIKINNKKIARRLEFWQKQAEEDSKCIEKSSYNFG